MLSKKQEAFLDQLQQRKAHLHLTQAAIAAYLGTSQSSVSRKMKGTHPWTADEQDTLKRWLHMAELPEDPPPSRDDPVLEEMEKVILGLTRHKRPEVYKLVVSVTRGLQDHMTPSGKEAYRAFCALVG